MVRDLYTSRSAKCNTHAVIDPCGALKLKFWPYRQNDCGSAHSRHLAEGVDLLADHRFYGLHHVSLSGLEEVHAPLLDLQAHVAGQPHSWTGSRGKHARIREALAAADICW